MRGRHSSLPSKQEVEPSYTQEVAHIWILISPVEGTAPLTIPGLYKRSSTHLDIDISSGRNSSPNTPRPQVGREPRLSSVDLHYFVAPSQTEMGRRVVQDPSGSKQALPYYTRVMSKEWGFCFSSRKILCSPHLTPSKATMLPAALQPLSIHGTCALQSQHNQQSCWQLFPAL